MNMEIQNDEFNFDVKGSKNGKECEREHKPRL